MGERPGYLNYLKHLYNRKKKGPIITCKMNGETVYFKNITKKSRSTIPPILLFLVLMSPIVLLLVFKDHSAYYSWFDIEFMLGYLAALLLVAPFIFSLCYWLLSFQKINAEEAEEESLKAKTEGKKNRSDRILWLIISILNLLFVFSMSFTASFIRFSYDFVSHNQSN